MKTAAVILLIVIFLAAVLLDKTLRGVSTKELRRRSREGHDRRATAVYKLAAYGGSARLDVWLAGVLSAGGLILFAAKNAWWLGLMVVIVTWALWASRPICRPAMVTWQLAAAISVLFAKKVSFLQPILGRLAQWLGIGGYQEVTNVFEKEDLVDLLKMQGRRVENRISKEDLKRAMAALKFNDIGVSAAMTPRRKVKWAVASDAIGPMVMDELHQSGQKCFPVIKAIVKNGNPEVVGTLFLNDLLHQLKDGGRIRDIMKPGAGYINESQNINEAVGLFSETGGGLLVVVNDFEEVVGVLTLSDVHAQIFG